MGGVALGASAAARPLSAARSPGAGLPESGRTIQTGVSRQGFGRMLYWPAHFAGPTEGDLE